MTTLKLPQTLPPPTEDAERLKQAFDGLGTDEKAIIWILGHRNASQRRKIRDTYKQLYNESLVDHLYSELSGDFRHAVILWMTDPPERDAKLENDALKLNKKGVQHLKVIVEIACTTSPHHLMAVRQACCSLFACSFEEDIASNIPQPLRKLLVGLVSSYRYDKEVVDKVLAESEASQLHEAFKTKQLDHGNHRIETFGSYKLKYGNHINLDIKSSGNDDLGSLLQLVIRCLESPEAHFAEVVRESIVGLRTDEESLTRVIVSQAEIDLMIVIYQYQLLYKSSLDDAVIDDTSGDYKDFMMTLLGARV
ncbi:hypothetical protein UlMin_019781 [Ulmus minor]